jgi:tetratricopeptide (TPR) repeat protein
VKEQNRVVPDIMVIIKKAMTKYFLAPLLLVIFLSINIQHLSAGYVSEYQVKGIIVDTIRCKSNPKFSYALYLPTNYSDVKKWPVIFVFDPGARGKVAVSGFVQAAEKLGFIIVCSNNSRNQLPENELSEAINSLFLDVEDRFSIDIRRIYTAGFSGGSRIASMIALQNKIVSGVIACGAGFPGESDFRNTLSFSYIGLVGNRDMNYIEMCDLVKKMDNLGMNIEIRIFNGGHSWPSSDLLLEAVEWMELQAMNKGTKIKNPAFINAQFEKYNRKARLLLKNGKLTESALAFEYLIKDFPNHVTSMKLNETLDSLEKSSGYIKALRNWNKNREWELEMQNNLISKVLKQARAGSLPDSIRISVSSQIKMLRYLETTKDTNNQLTASRVLMLLNTVCFETGRTYFSLKQFKAASICYQVQSMVEPKDNSIQFLLAKVYALDNDTDNSLKSLEKAIKLGFNNRKLIESDPAFLPLKNQKKFRDILMELK